jgi:hypothetical protein
MSPRLLSPQKKKRKTAGQSDVTCQDDDDLENDFTRMLLKKHFKR